MQDGVPLGDRGLVHLANIRSVEKVVGVSTFVLKGENKVRCAPPHSSPSHLSRNAIAAATEHRHTPRSLRAAQVITSLPKSSRDDSITLPAH